MKTHATKSAREGSHRASSEERHDRRTSRGCSLAPPDKTSYQAMADASPQVRRAARFQEMADNSPRVRAQAVPRVTGGLASVGSDEKNRLLGGVSDVTSTTNTGPTWGNHGHFDWRVGFNAVGRPSMAGWIVQKVVNRYSGLQNGAGGAVAPPAGLTPQYWEAWAVSAAGNVTPAIAGDNDYWIRPSMGANTKGSWSMSASVHFTTTNPATQGFAPAGVAAAGMLLSTTNRPSGLGVAHLHRRAEGTWDSTGAAPTHTGSAA